MQVLWAVYIPLATWLLFILDRPKHNVIAFPFPLYHPGGCHTLLPSSPAAPQCGCSSPSALQCICSSPSAHSFPWRAGPPESVPAQWGTAWGNGGGEGQTHQVVGSAESAMKCLIHYCWNWSHDVCMTTHNYVSTSSASQSQSQIHNII